MRTIKAESEDIGKKRYSNESSFLIAWLTVIIIALMILLPWYFHR